LRHHQKMPAVFSDPVQTLALLPLGQTEALERQWLQDTLAWLKGIPPDRRTERLRHLADGIRTHTSSKERFQQIWLKAFASRVFAEAGLPEATSLSRELIARVKRRLLPQLEDEVDLYSALHMADLDGSDAEWVAALPDEDVIPWRELMGASTADFPVAIRLLALRAASIGLSPAVMKVMPHRYETESPFYQLIEAVGPFTRMVGRPDDRQQLQEIIFRCRVSAGLSHARMEEEGVSSDLVFRLDLVVAQLDRIDVLLRVMCAEEDGRRFAAMLVRAFADERSVHGLLRNSVNRMARRIVTHTGQTGEHYIAQSRVEWAKMGYGAIGAGGITAFTALFKYFFAATALAPLWIGVAHSLNYTVSFVLMQFLGWRLASKMPSMTAAALCDALEKDDGMHAEVELVAAITRTQCVVTIGNLLGAIPLAALIDFFFRLKNGSPFLSSEAALHGLASMHPFESLTLPFAALTGCFLWLSSLVAGWTANWMVLNRIPAGIAQSRKISRSIGAGPTLRLAQIVKLHLSGVAGYTCLGLLLGLLPFVGVFAGLPLEVRHITLASASVTYDVSSLAWRGAIPWPSVCWALLGLLATGLLNFSVSFALGLWLALRARNLGTGGRKKLLLTLWNEFRLHPSRFLWRHEFATEPTEA
jgi:site-specific recombinase